MIIQHAILHILDMNTGNLIASQGEMAVDNVGVVEYIEKLTAKVSNGDVKTGTLAPGYVKDKLAESDFAHMTTDLATKLFGTIEAIETVQPGDLLSFQATTDEGRLFGLLKLNFTPRYAHTVEYIDDRMVNNLVLNQAILPAATQSVEEAILVNLDTWHYQLLEKKYLIDVHRATYFSDRFLEIVPEVSVKENIQTIKRTVKNVAEQDDDLPEHEVLAMTQEVIYDALESGSINTDMIAEKVFSDNISAQQQYKEKMTDKMVDKSIPVENTQKYEKKFRVQKFKLDSGIEISIPMSVYQDKNKVEFMNHPDGTMSLVIKDIDSVLNKFTV
ncbi:nucleoid-associated protein [Leuconostoc carnosum]|uniref:nucleoid-associated protein n=1 Tax=Leuconostoc carnosum TaxID=1252 RepID=UPI0012397B10|nr:nucleoid-associated protein [Leuconostoc carnosum]KAA8371996.1 nucleoid-associated protein [Leuconostoc carnosum]